MERVTLICLAAIAWTAIYVCCACVFPTPVAIANDKKKTNDFCNRIVSLIHAVVACVLSGWCLTHEGLNFGSPNSATQTTVLSISLGYFFYDFLACHALGLSTMSSSFHHAMCLVGLGITIYSGVSASEVCAATLLTELSNPFMHLRFLLRYAGWGQTATFHVNEILFVSVFFVARLILGSPLTYLTYKSAKTPVVVKLAAFGLMAVSVYWFGLMVRLIVRMFADPKPSSFIVPAVPTQKCKAT